MKFDNDNQLIAHCERGRPGKRNFRNVPKTARLDERFRQFTERVRRRFTGALPKMYKKYSGISALTFYQPNFCVSFSF